MGKPGLGRCSEMPPVEFNVSVNADSDIGGDCGSLACWCKQVSSSKQEKNVLQVSWNSMGRKWKEYDSITCEISRVNLSAASFLFDKTV